jgi:hypothetical protein
MIDEDGGLARGLVRCGWTNRVVEKGFARGRGDRGSGWSVGWSDREDAEWPTSALSVN